MLVQQSREDKTEIFLLLGDKLVFRARAKDKGSPPLTSTYVTVRIDTFDAEQKMVDIVLDVSLEVFQANIETFIRILSQILEAEVKIASAVSNENAKSRRRRETNTG